MKTRIIIDSTADLRDNIKENFTVVPLTLHFGDEEYIDGVTITNIQFYEKLIECDVLPQTSQATPSDFTKVFEQVYTAGDKAVVITLSSELSGTYQSAVIAASDYPDTVYVVDSCSASIGTGILAELALDMLKEGLSAKEIADRLCVERDNICVVAMLDTLEYLKKGGRISKTVAFAGGLLSIKPVVSLENGKINILGKARGSKQGNNLLVSEIEKAGGVDFSRPVLLGYTGLSDATLKKYIEDSRTLWEQGASKLDYNVLGSVIGTHAGPGAVAVAFFKKKGD